MELSDTMSQAVQWAIISVTSAFLLVWLTLVVKESVSAAVLPMVWWCGDACSLRLEAAVVVFDTIGTCRRTVC